MIFNGPVELEIRPEPDEAERAAIVAALAEERPAPSGPYASGWRRAGIEQQPEPPPESP